MEIQITSGLLSEVESEIQRLGDRFTLDSVHKVGWHWEAKLSEKDSPEEEDSAQADESETTGGAKVIQFEPEDLSGGEKDV